MELKTDELQNFTDYSWSLSSEYSFVGYTYCDIGSQFYGLILRTRDTHTCCQNIGSVIVTVSTCFNQYLGCRSRDWKADFPRARRPFYQVSQRGGKHSYLDDVIVFGGKTFE